MVTINKDQELYVVSHGGWNFCLGFDYALRQSQALTDWLGKHGVPVTANFERGTQKAYEDYQTLIDAASNICTNKKIRCDIELTPQLIGLEGKRVEVIDKHGEKRRFLVGKSTGWIPVHLEIAKITSSGGGTVTGAPFKSVKVIR